MHEGLITSLNKIREVSSNIYHQYIPELTAGDDISKFAEPILNVPEVYNEFCNSLVNRIVYTQFMAKIFKNPFKILEGEKLPLGYAGQEVYTNPAKGRQYNPNDFAGLLVKYEADVKVQYTTINYDMQYPVTFSRQALKKAFVSWSSLEAFINDLSNSLYNGAYINEYNAVRKLIAGAYKGNEVVIKTANAVTDEASAKSFTESLRTLFLDFQTPTDEFNAWHKNDKSVGKPVTTWTNPEDIIIIVRNDVRSKLDVMNMATAFNIEYAKLLGQILSVKDFNIYNDDGSLNYDGSKIQAIICDKSFFRIKTQDMWMDEFYNGNNRSIQYYLNDIKMFNMSLFANAVVIATEEPSIEPTSMSYGVTSVTIDEVGDVEGLEITTTPITANATISYESDNEDVFIVEADSKNNKIAKVTATGEGTATLTATCGDVTATVEITVPTSA